MKKVRLFYRRFIIMFRMAKSFDSKLIGVAAGDSLGISKMYFATSNRRSTVRKIRFLGVSRKGRKTKNVTSCDNVFLTNVLLAWSRAPRKASSQNGNQPILEYKIFNVIFGISGVILLTSRTKLAYKKGCVIHEF